MWLRDMDGARAPCVLAEVGAAPSKDKGQVEGAAWEGLGISPSHSSHSGSRGSSGSSPHGPHGETET